jgi:hypothetical protein
MANPRTDFRVSLALTPALASLGAAEPGANPGGSVGQVTVAGPTGARLRIEALDPHVVRIWLKPSGNFLRKRSLAMQAAPNARSPVTRSDGDAEVLIGTGALDVPVTLAAGANRIVIEGREDGWNSVQLDQIEILPR